MAIIRPSQQDQLIAEAYWDAHRTNFGLFFRKSFETISPGVEYLHNWHVDLITEHLQACATGQIRRLIVNMPPRHLKSSIITTAWPAWLMALNPSERIMCASYSRTLSIEHSVNCRLIMESEWYNYLFPDTIISSDQNEKSKFVTMARGHRIATSVGATTTGSGGKWLISDDALKAVDADSEVARKNANNWFDQAYATRLDDKRKGVIIAVEHRLHTDDLTGHLLEQGGWTQLCIPVETPIAIHYKLNDYEHIFKPKQLLHAARMDKKILDAERVQLGERSYSAQYLQEPVAAGGNIIKEDWFRIYEDADPYIHYVIQSYDTAFTEDTANDPTACTVWGVIETKKGYGMLLLDAWTEHLEFPELRSRMIEEYHYQYGVNKKKVGVVLIEDKGSGISVVQEFQRAGLPVRKYNPGKASKTTRLNLVSPHVEAGFVWLPGENGKFDEFCRPFLQQIKAFPAGAHDDLCDSFTQAVAMLRDMDYAELKTVDIIEEPVYNDEHELENPYAM